MSYLFNQGYKSEINSVVINEKINYLYGSNGVLKGYELTSEGLNITVKNETAPDKIGLALIYGTIVAYYLVGNENYVSITLPNTNGKYYIYGEYQHYQKTFKIYYTTDVNNALGRWKIFLGHAVVSNGKITELKGLSNPNVEETDTKYRRIPTIAEAFSYLYNTTIQISGDVEEIVRRHISELQEQINNIRTEIENIKQDFLNRIEIENLAKRSKLNNNSLNCSQVKTFDNNISKKGRLLIKLPVTSFLGEVILVTIQGTEKLTGKTFNLLLGGTLDSTDKIWKRVSANVQGECNFDFVSFGRSSNSDIGIYICLGTNDTVWDHVSLIINQVIVTNIPSSTMNDTLRKLWRDNWKIGIYDYAVIPNSTSNITAKVKTGGPQEGEFVFPDRQIIAGEGLTGGGNLSSDVNIAVNFGTTSNTVARGNHNHNSLYTPLYNSGSDIPNRIAVYDSNGKLTSYKGFSYSKLDYLKNLNQDIMELIGGKSGPGHTHSNISIKAGDGLGGGGSLDQDRQIWVNFGTTSNTVARGNHNHNEAYEPLINMSAGANRIATYNSSGKLSYYPGFDPSKLEYIKNLNQDIMELIGGKSGPGHTHSNINIKAGDGLGGGGSLDQDRYLWVNFGTTGTTVARGNHDHSGVYEPLINMSAGANKIATYNSNGKLNYYSGFDASKLDYIKNLNQDIMQLINNKAGSDHNHDGKYLKLTGGTVSGNLTVSGTTKVADLTIQNRKVVLSNSTPTNKVDKMIWIKCR